MYMIKFEMLHIGIPMLLYQKIFKFLQWLGVLVSVRIPCINVFLCQIPKSTI